MPPPPANAKRLGLRRVAHHSLSYCLTTFCASLQGSASRAAPKRAGPCAGARCADRPGRGPRSRGCRPPGDSPGAVPGRFRLASVRVECDWIHTSTLGPEPGSSFPGYHGVWVVPASPYADGPAVIRAIRFARRLDVPFCGTCAGFQHALLEFAEARLGMFPRRRTPNSTLARQTRCCPAVMLPGRAARGQCASPPGVALGAELLDDGRRGGIPLPYGLNPRYAGGFLTGGRSGRPRGTRRVRCARLNSTDHRFFVATLFQPERAALGGRVPPLVREFPAAPSRRTAPPAQ